jgi:hypothetical protein
MEAAVQLSIPTNKSIFTVPATDSHRQIKLSAAITFGYWSAQLRNAKRRYGVMTEQNQFIRTCLYFREADSDFEF